MLFSIHENKRGHCIHVDCSTQKTDFIVSLLYELNIKDVSVFVDENNYFGLTKNKKYALLGKMTIDELLQNSEILKKDLLIFDEKIDVCYVDKELDLFNKSKIMINIDIERRVFMVFINTLNTDLTLQRIKQINIISD